jgi:hypothetical protein
MKHSTHLVLFSGGGCMLLAALLFGLGVAFEQLALKFVAKWLWLLAIFIAFLPLLVFGIGSILEWVRRK